MTPMENICKHKHNPQTRCSEKYDLGCSSLCIQLTQCHNIIMIMPYIGRYCSISIVIIMSGFRPFIFKPNVHFL